MTLLTVLRTSAHDLSAIPDGTVHTVITSPPYYGLRSYAGDQDVEWPTVTYRLNEWTEPVTVQGCEPGCKHEWVDGPVKSQQPQRNGPGGQWADERNAPARLGSAISTTQGRYCLHCGGWRGPLGLEPSPVAYIGHLILCLREWRRVLRDDGTVWVNLGDSYASGSSGDRNIGDPNNPKAGSGPKSMYKAQKREPVAGLKPKDLLGIPWMFAFAARADGWYLRSDIIWAKGLSFLPNYAGSSMPESVRSRPSKGHEYLFLLAKSERYYYDAEAVKEPVQQSSIARVSQNNGHPNWNGNRARASTQAPQTMDINKAVDACGRNLRSVWAINPQPYPGSHYAVFPERLVEPCVKAGSSEKGACPTCGAPWRRVVDKQTHSAPVEERNGRVGHNGAPPQQSGWFWTPPTSTTIGWLPTCACYGIPPMPDLPDEPEKPEGIDEGAPAPCAKCEGVGIIPGPPMFPDDATTCPKCHGTGGKPASAEWLAWQAERAAWQAEYDRVLAEEIIPLLALVNDTMPVVPCKVLDPFAGSGTTGVVSIRQGREAFLGDISNEYLSDHVLKRVEQVQMEMAL